jgi:hypothetical protein
LSPPVPSVGVWAWALPKPRNLLHSVVLKHYMGLGRHGVRQRSLGAGQGARTVGRECSKASLPCCLNPRQPPHLHLCSARPWVPRNPYLSLDLWSLAWFGGSQGNRVGQALEPVVFLWLVGCGGSLVLWVQGTAMVVVEYFFFPPHQALAPSDIPMSFHPFSRVGMGNHRAMLGFDVCCLRVDPVMSWVAAPEELPLVWWCLTHVGFGGLDWGALGWSVHLPQSPFLFAHSHPQPRIPHCKCVHIVATGDVLAQGLVCRSVTPIL